MKSYLLVMLILSALVSGCASGDPRRQPDYRGFAVRSDAELGPLKQHKAGFYPETAPAIDDIGSIIAAEDAEQLELATTGTIWLLGEMPRLGTVTLGLTREDTAACAYVQSTGYTCHNRQGGKSIVALGRKAPATL